MKRFMLASCLALLLAGLALGKDAATAKADLADSKGGHVGTAKFKETSKGVSLALEVSSLPPGVHGFHIHAVGTCDPPNFASAGGHFNPDGKHHGWMHPAGARVGDLFNLENNSDGGGGWNSAFPA